MTAAAGDSLLECLFEPPPTLFNCGCCFTVMLSLAVGTIPPYYPAFLTLGGRKEETGVGGKSKLTQHVSQIFFRFNCKMYQMPTTRLTVAKMHLSSSFTTVSVASFPYSCMHGGDGIQGLGNELMQLS